MTESPDAALREALRTVRRLEIVTRRLVQEMLSGGYLSSFQGTGVEFAEVREYCAGDDPRHIDWNVTARLNRPFVKRFTEERELRLLLVVDASASCLFGSGPKSKRDTAAELCAALASAAMRHRDLIGLVLFGRRILRFLPPRKTRGHVRRILRELLVPAPSREGTDLPGAIEFARRILKRRATVFIVSDFRDRSFEGPLRLLRSRHDVIAVRLSDPREASVPEAGVLELEDPETGERLALDTRRREVRRRVAEIEAASEGASRSAITRCGVDAIELVAGGDVAGPLLRFFRARMRRRSSGR